MNKYLHCKKQCVAVVGGCLGSSLSSSVPSLWLFKNTAGTHWLCGAKQIYIVVCAVLLCCISSWLYSVGPEHFDSNTFCLKYIFSSLLNKNQMSLSEDRSSVLVYPLLRIHFLLLNHGNPSFRVSYSLNLTKNIQFLTQYLSSPKFCFPYLYSAKGRSGSWWCWI